MDTDFSSLERELRGDERGHEIPSAYADLAEQDEGDEDDENYQDLRKSG